MSDTLTVYLSGDTSEGNPEATITINGTAVGGTLDAQASNAADDTEAFIFTGDFGSSPTVAVSMVNQGPYGGSDPNRILYLDGFSYDGVAQLSDKLLMSYDQTATYNLTSVASVAIRAANFVNSFGVDVHLDYWDTSYGLSNGSGPNTALVVSSLAYLGVDQLRVGGPTSATLPEMLTLMQDGYKFDVIMPSTSSTAMLPEQLSALSPIENAIVAIEGPNETNLTSDFSWNGQTSLTAAAAYQQILYIAVKDDSALASKSVYNLTLGGVGASDYLGLGNLSAYANDGNVHVYYSNGTPPASTLQYAETLAEASTPSDPMVITETNYTSAPSIAGSVSDDVQARYDLDLMMDATKDGVSSTYFYELLDEHSDPNDTDNEDHYGLFNADGTPKESATAIHNLMALLADTGANALNFRPGTLTYSISGLPASGNTMLLQKSDGTFDLVVWAEPEIWSVASASEIPATPRTVSVSFEGDESSVAVFDPLTGTSALSDSLNASLVTITVTDHPIILEITPSTTGSVVLPSNLGTVSGSTGTTSVSGSGGSTSVAGGSTVSGGDTTSGSSGGTTATGGGTANGGSSSGTGSSGSGTATGTSSGNCGDGTVVPILSLAAYSAQGTNAVRGTVAVLSAATGGPTLVALEPGEAAVTPGAGQTDVALITPAADATVALPAGYAAALLQGGADATLGDGGQSGVLLGGNDGDDTLVANGTGDTIVGGQRANTISAAANATVFLGAGANTVGFTGGANTVDTGTGKNTVFLGNGTDLVLSAGQDQIVAGNGDDTVFSSGNTVFYGGSGALTYIAQDGAPTVAAGSGAAVVFGSSQNGGVVFGGSGPTTYIAGNGSSVYVGGSGKSIVFEGPAGGVIYGGSGPGAFVAPGNTVVVAGEGSSTIAGGPNDQIYLVGGADNYVLAGSGNMTLTSANSTGRNTYVEGSGPEQITGGPAGDVFEAGGGDATITGGGGSNLYLAFAGGAGGTQTITDFNTGADHLGLFGYSGDVDQFVMQSATVQNGSTTLTLPDGTRYILQGVSSLGNGSLL